MNKTHKRIKQGIIENSIPTEYALNPRGEIVKLDWADSGNWEFEVKKPKVKTGVSLPENVVEVEKWLWEMVVAESKRMHRNPWGQMAAILLEHFGFDVQPREFKKAQEGKVFATPSVNAQVTC